MKIQNLLQSAAAASVGGLLVTKGVQASPVDTFQRRALTVGRAPAAVDAPMLSPARRDAPTFYSGSVSYAMPVPPCFPPSGPQELVDFTIDYSGHYKDTVDTKTGVTTFTGHSQESGTGIGETSGNTYHLISTNNDHGEMSFSPPFPGSVQYVNNYKIVEQGSGVVYDYHATVAYTYDGTSLTYHINHINGGC